MTTDIIQITPRNPMIVMDKQTLKETLYEVLAEMGIKAQVPKEREIQETEYPTYLAKKYLASRGYRVLSHEGFKSLLREHDIKPIRRGKDNWYQIRDLNKLPDKTK